MHTLTRVELLQEGADPLAGLDRAGVVLSRHFFLLQRSQKTFATPT